MDLMRRTFIAGLGTMITLTLAATAGLLKSGRAMAAEWNKSAFDSMSLPDVLKIVGGAGAIESRDIVINAPDNAENGAVVQIDVASRIPGTSSMAIIIEKNPRPLLADVEFTNGAEAYIFLVAKMAETSRIRVLARSGGKTFVASKQVSVTTSGC